jgi:hypothetical protein
MTSASPTSWALWPRSINRLHGFPLTRLPDVQLGRSAGTDPGLVDMWCRPRAYAPAFGGLARGQPVTHGDSRGAAGNDEAPGQTVFDLGLRLVGRGGVEPPTFHFSGGRSYQLSYLPKRAKLYNRRAARPESVRSTSATAGAAPRPTLRVVRDRMAENPVPVSQNVTDYRRCGHEKAPDD